ncbi:MAG: RNA polymerase sigma factor (sigma-70 family) [Hyphomicrobiaceae bacterium]|jgi:RNA polymerase sigma factor (sigma-70 family)
MTSLHVRRACDGDMISLNWIVERFSPCLLAQAHYRLSRGLGGHYEPEDLVQDVWAVALPKLAAMEFPGASDSQRLLGFLGRTLLNLYGNLLQKHLAGKPQRWRPQGGSTVTDGMQAMPAATSGVVSRAVRAEQHCELRLAIESLDAQDRELIVLRAFEQIPNNIIAEQLGVKPNTIAVRYRRCLDRLARQLPDSIFADLLGE